VIGVGSSIGNYTVLERLGAGGMGTVWLAENARIGKRAVVKTLHPNPGALGVEARFLREAQILAALHHPHIVEIYDFGQIDLELYYIMELLEGETLETRIQRSGNLSIEASISIVVQVCEGLAAVHSRNVVHRDLKPANIHTATNHDGGEFVRIIDFGIAHVADTEKITRDELVGTAYYMAPEQWRVQVNGAGGPVVSAATDIFAVGVVLFEMLTGQVPFKGVTVPEIGFNCVHGARPSVRKSNEDLPAWIDDVVTKCLAVAPCDRYQTAMELKAALQEGSARRPVVTERPEPHVERGRSWSPSKAFGACALLTCLALSAKYLLSLSAADTQSPQVPLAVRKVDLSHSVINNEVSAPIPGSATSSTRPAESGTEKPTKRVQQTNNRPTATSSDPLEVDCEEQCKASSRCTLVEGRCVVATDSDCLKRQSITSQVGMYSACGYLGKCTARNGVCIATKESDCQNSFRCYVDGKCNLKGDSCEATSDASCARPCSGVGNCTAKDGMCIPTVDAHCRASQVCRNAGACTLVGTSCVASLQLDCEASLLCKSIGNCVLSAGRCRKQEASEPTPASSAKVSPQSSSPAPAPPPPPAP
jgi:serine/threonine protein kinase